MPLTHEKQTTQEFTELEWKLAVSRFACPPFVRPRDDRATPEAIRPERLRLASAGIKYLSAIIRQLVELRNEAEHDEYGVLCASQHAFEAGCLLLIDAAIFSARSGRQIPYGVASTDSQGGIRVEWVRPTASVHLVVAATASQKPYIYHEVPSDFGTEPATAEVFAHWLSKID